MKYVFTLEDSFSLLLDAEVAFQKIR